MPKYDVLRQHDGDKQYWAGDTRELTKADAKHLVDLGVLALAVDDGDDGEKVEPPVGNQSEPPASNQSEAPPANRMEPALQTKPRRGSRQKSGA